MIELSSSTKVYGSAEVVPAVSLQVKKHEKLVLRRTSGSGGKPTTLKIINRLVEPAFNHRFGKVSGKS